MTRKELEDRVLQPPDGGFGAPPPPSPELLAAMQGMRPVRTRTRFGAFLAVGLAGLIAPAVTLLHTPMRRDLAALPVAWVIAAAGLWALSFGLSLAAALVPRREDVLPAPGRASRMAATALAVLLLFGLFATVEVPGVSVHPKDVGMTLSRSCTHCLLIVVEIALPLLLVGLFALRRLVPVGRTRIGMALGAAGGAAGGLVLVFICPIATTAHVVLSHVGGAIVAAALGALLLPGLLRR
jgi:hypothetical protein